MVQNSNRISTEWTSDAPNAPFGQKPTIKGSDFQRDSSIFTGSGERTIGVIGEYASDRCPDRCDPREMAAQAAAQDY
jgi:hypothetical protein